MTWAAVATGGAGIVSSLIGSKSKNKTSTATPWAPAAAAMNPAIAASRDMTFDDSGAGRIRVDDWNGVDDATLQSAQMLRDAGADNSAIDFYRQQLTGETNPYLDAAFDKASGKVRSKLDSQFAAAGRYGSADHERVIGEGYNDLANQVYGGQYNNDMARRFDAAGALPQAQLGQAATLEAAGQAQGNIDTADYDFKMKRLAEFYGLNSPLLGAGQTQTTPMYSNTGGQVAGGLLQMAGAYFGRPQDPAAPPAPQQDWSNVQLPQYRTGL